MKKRKQYNATLTCAISYYNTGMKIHQAEYLISAPALKDCPDLGATPEIVLVGRSNVGKSSWINSMLQRNNLARTSNTPGKTRLINFYPLTFSEKAEASLTKMIFVDLPGYGYAKISKAKQQEWQQHLENYLLKRDTIRLVIQLIDARHGPQENDQLMMEWLQFHGLRVQVILNKIDKISRNDLSKHLAQTARKLDHSATDIIAYSSEKHIGRDRAWQVLLNVLHQ